MSATYDLDRWLARLKTDRERIPWTERRSMAASLAKPLVKPDEQGNAVRLMHLLADDPKWEVRREVASHLTVLGDDEFVSLAAKLTQDTNSYVRTAAERALDLRRKGSHGSSGRRKGLDQVIAEFELLSATQGNPASDTARALAMRLYEVSVAATVHDLRGVLTSARSKLDRIQSEVVNTKPDGTTLREGLRKVDDRLAYLEKFVDAMGTYSQPIAPERASARLAQLVSDAHEVAVDAIHLPPGRVKSSIVVDDGITVMVATHQIVVAIANVLKNAFEAVCDAGDGRHGHVRVAADSGADGEVCIVVKDNGIGINAEDLRELRAFVPGRTTKKGRGTGFGLPIAQRYVAAHGGSISLESVENVMTTVTIVLPSEAQEGTD